MTRWQLATATDPDTSLGEIVFTPASEEGEEGSTEFSPEPAGAMWMTIVEDFVTGPEMHVFISGDLREGPHDRNRRQLEAALAEIPKQFPHLRILGLKDEPVERQGARIDPAVEAVKDLVRERFAAAWEGLEAPNRLAMEGPLKQLLDPISRAGSETELMAACEQSVRVIMAAPPAFVAFVHPVMLALEIEAEDQPAYSAALARFCAQYVGWRVSAPRIIH